MPDVLTPSQRRFLMSRIRGRDTKPEMQLRKGLHGRGLRYRLHQKKLPGRPDLVFPKYRTAVFVHGCFWHRHQCALFKWPATRRDFWRKKINKNAERDRQAVEALIKRNWRVLTVWECALRGPGRLRFEKVLDRAEAFIRRQKRIRLEIAGRN